MGLGEVTRQASFFLLDKYKFAKRILADISPAELLTEEATNSEQKSPDARTMKKISEAAFEFDEYWRIMDVLHRRLHCVNFKDWRQSYKALVLLEFLLTHGPDGIAEEFLRDMDVIRDLAAFTYVDDKGFDWGSNMKKRSERIIKLLRNEPLLRDARKKALKLSRDIKGFGNLNFIITTASSSCSSSPSTSKFSSKSSSFGSFSSDRSSSSDREELIRKEVEDDNHHQHHQSSKNFNFFKMIEEDKERLHVWEDTSVDDRETRSLLHGEKGSNGKIGFRSLSEVGRVMRKKFERQTSVGF